MQSLRAIILVSFSFIAISCTESNKPTAPSISSSNQLTNTLSSEASSSGLATSSSVTRLRSSIGGSSSFELVLSSSSVVPFSSIATSSNSVLPSSNSKLSYCNTAGNCDTFIDSRDGREYNWTKIGTQTWMAENLRYSGDDGSGSKVYTLGWCYGVGGVDTTQHQDSTTCDNGYGRLYTWAEAMGFATTFNSAKAVTNDLIDSIHQGICPTGWHVPIHSEMESLSFFIRSEKEEVEGIFLKAIISSDLSGWNNAQYNSKNPYAFSAVPAGTRYPTGVWNRRGEVARFWTASELSASTAWAHYLDNIYTKFDSSLDTKTVAYSIRCVMDTE